MPFAPFPLSLLGRLAEPPLAGLPLAGLPLAGPPLAGACENLELLPFLRWVAGHSVWRAVATVADGRGFLVPVLPRALAAGAAVSCRLLGGDGLGSVPAGSLDFLHVTAEFAPGELAGLLGAARCRLAPGGLVLAPPLEGRASGFVAVALPVAAGGSVLLQREGEAVHPVLAWLQTLDAAALADFGRFFVQLAGRLAAAPGLDGPGRKEAGKQTRLQRGLRQRLEEARTRERQHLEELAGLRRERAALYASTSWRLTAPLRRAMVGLGKGRACSGPAAAAPPVAPAVLATDRAFARFLSSGRILRFEEPAPSGLSAVLVVEGEAAHALACLDALAASREALDLVVVANGATEATDRLLQRVAGARILRNAVRLSPAAALAEALAEAMRGAPGHTVLLLDPRVRLQPGALGAALAALRDRPGAGAVTGKVTAADGSLVEAGALLGDGGEVLGFPRGYPADSPDAQFCRPVPAGSGLFLLLRSVALREVGGLGTAFPSRGHAVADLCLRLGAQGWETLFEPLAVAVLDDAGPPPERGTGADALFAVRHAAAIACHGVPPGRFPRWPIMVGHRKRLLLIDDRVPYPELGAGYPRAARMIQDLHAMGWFVTVFPNMEAEDDWPSVYERFPRGVEFMLGYGRDALGHFLHQRAGFYDAVIVSRPHNMRDYLASRGDTPRPARLVYDAEALFTPREVMRLEQAGQTVGAERRQAMLDEEVGLTRAADLVTAVSETEAAVFRRAGCPNVRVLGLGVAPVPAGPGFAERRDLLFVGALGEDDSPNTDALLWFVSEIMPVLDGLIGPGYRLLVAGRCQAPLALALASGRVRILGLVDDLSALYATARIFVAPTRYAAGLPLKVHEAAGRGLPVVGTTLLGCQLGWRDGRDILLAATAEAFASACARLYSDPALWYALRRGGLDRLLEEVRREDFTGTLGAVAGLGVS